jgi:hypothetical protein
MFRRNISPPSSGSKYKQTMKQVATCHYQETNQHGASRCFMLILAWFAWHVLPKRRLISSGLYCIISQKIKFIMTVQVRLLWTVKIRSKNQIFISSWDGMYQHGASKNKNKKGLYPISHFLPAGGCKIYFSIPNIPLSRKSHDIPEKGHLFSQFYFLPLKINTVGPWKCPFCYTCRPHRPATVSSPFLHPSICASIFNN